MADPNQKVRREVTRWELEWLWNRAFFYAMQKGYTGNPPKVQAAQIDEFMAADFLTKEMTEPDDLHWVDDNETRHARQ